MKHAIASLLIICAIDAALDRHFDHIGNANKMIGYSQQEIEAVNRLAQPVKHHMTPREQAVAILYLYGDAR